jgi:plastocyanin
MGGHSMRGMQMSDAEMAPVAARYWATHARVGPTASVPLAVTAVSETVTVDNFIFNVDGDFNTQIDTVKIQPGDQVVWIWSSGTHTITSGNGGTDPQSGVLFNAPMDITFTQFSFVFPNAGTFNYYCQFHELFDMKGVVRVQDLTGVGDTPVGTGIGFASHPWPNPALGAVSFRYDLRRAGRVRAQVVDARGRLVATVVNEDQAAGTYTRSWDGGMREGLAPAGRYFLRLTLPGYAGTQAITITR